MAVTFLDLHVKLAVLQIRCRLHAIDPSEARERRRPEHREAGRRIGKVDVQRLVVVARVVVERVRVDRKVAAEVPRKPDARLLRHRLPHAVVGDRDVRRRRRHNEVARILSFVRIGIGRIWNRDAQPMVVPILLDQYIFTNGSQYEVRAHLRNRVPRTLGLGVGGSGCGVGDLAGADQDEKAINVGAGVLPVRPPNRVLASYILEIASNQERFALARAGPPAPTIHTKLRRRGLPCQKLPPAHSVQPAWQTSRW